MNYKIKGKKCTEWTISELKKALTRRKEKISGKKQELCDRLRESLKHPINKSKSSAKKPSSIKIKPINIKRGEFVFYSTLYYQNPQSKMASEELAKYGLTKTILNRHKSYQSLWNELSQITET